MGDVIVSRFGSIHEKNFMGEKIVKPFFKTFAILLTALLISATAVSAAELTDKEIEKIK